MNRMWLYGITGVGFLILAYLFATKTAVLSGAVFAVLGIAYLIAAFKNKK
jgi:hypothetical protein